MQWPNAKVSESSMQMKSLCLINIMAKREEETCFLSKTLLVLMKLRVFTMLIVSLLWNLNDTKLWLTIFWMDNRRIFWIRLLQINLTTLLPRWIDSSLSWKENLCLRNKLLICILVRCLILWTSGTVTLIKNLLLPKFQPFHQAPPCKIKKFNSLI